MIEPGERVAIPTGLAFAIAARLRGPGPPALGTRARARRHPRQLAGHDRRGLSRSVARAARSTTASETVTIEPGAAHRAARDRAGRAGRARGGRRAPDDRARRRRVRIDGAMSDRSRTPDDAKTDDLRPKRAKSATQRGTPSGVHVVDDRDADRPRSAPAGRAGHADRGLAPTDERADRAWSR